MHVTLIYNPEAGEGDHDAEKLVRALSRRGDDVTPVSSRAYRPEKSDLLVIAGGDGTVGPIVRAIANRVDVPVLILPLGTANNVARSLGIARPELDLDVVRERWMPRPMDVARADDEIVIEAAGCGVVAKFMRAESDQEREGVQREAKSLADHVASSPQFDYRIEMGGEEIHGEAVLIEAMVISHMGPNLHLAPGADPGDGLLDLVVVDEKQCEPLLRYLRSGGQRHLPEFTTRRAAKLTIHCDAPWHLDDIAVDRRPRTIEVLPHAWTALAPSERWRPAG